MEKTYICKIKGSTARDIELTVADMKELPDDIQEISFEEVRLGCGRCGLKREFFERPCISNKKHELTNFISQ